MNETTQTDETPEPPRCEECNGKGEIEILDRAGNETGGAHYCSECGGTGVAE